MRCVAVRGKSVAMHGPIDILDLAGSLLVFFQLCWPQPVTLAISAE
jgi:hypothetical protein